MWEEKEWGEGMKAIYVSKKGAVLTAMYVLALALLITGAGIYLPSTASQPALAEPYRSGSADSQYVSLAINVDWGEEYLPDMLRVLAENNIRVTFFLTGRWCDINPQLAQTLVAAGHEIGNHGYSHASPNASSKEQIKEEIARTEQAVEQATGIKTRLYAPPSGEDQEHVLQAAEEAGYDTILWSVDTIDWQKPDAATIIDRVIGKLHGGAIILAHPTASTLEALPALIEKIQAEGYTFVPVSENLGI
jgi:probable sporulation protein (polysaccharide deacetylase family)